MVHHIGWVADHSYVANRIGCVVDQVVPMDRAASQTETDNGSAGGQEAEGVGQQDESNSSPAVERLCLHRT